MLTRLFFLMSKWCDTLLFLVEIMFCLVWLVYVKLNSAIFMFFFAV